MANDCCGVMRVVSRDKGAIKRLSSIMCYDDPEYFCYRVRAFAFLGGDSLDDAIAREGELYVCDFETDAAWSSESWFDGTDSPDRLIVEGYDEENRPIHGTAHLISVDRLCRKLGLGVELYATEPGCGFCEHFLANRDGELVFNESAEYTLEYPIGEDGDYDYGQEPVEKTEMELWKFSTPEEIYYGE